MIVVLKNILEGRNSVLKLMYENILIAYSETCFKSSDYINNKLSANA